LIRRNSGLELLFNLGYFRKPLQIYEPTILLALQYVLTSDGVQNYAHAPAQHAEHDHLVVPQTIDESHS